MAAVVSHAFRSSCLFLRVTWLVPFATHVIRSRRASTCFWLSEASSTISANSKSPLHQNGRQGPSSGGGLNDLCMQNSSASWKSVGCLLWGWYSVLKSVGGLMMDCGNHSWELSVATNTSKHAGVMLLSKLNDSDAHITHLGYQGRHCLDCKVVPKCLCRDVISKGGVFKTTRDSSSLSFLWRSAWLGWVWVPLTSTNGRDKAEGPGLVRGARHFNCMIFSWAKQWLRHWHDFRILNNFKGPSIFTFEHLPKMTPYLGTFLLCLASSVAAGFMFLETLGFELLSTVQTRNPASQCFLRVVVWCVTRLPLGWHNGRAREWKNRKNTSISLLIQITIWGLPIEHITLYLIYPH